MHVLFSHSVSTEDLLLILNPAFFIADHAGIRPTPISVLLCVLLDSVAFGFIVALIFWAFVKQKLPGNLCPYCHYDLVGHESSEITCPECGKAVIKRIEQSTIGSG